MNTQTKIKALREAGQTQRAHTIPHHGSYSNAEHTCQMLNLLYVLYPVTPSNDLVTAILLHDIPERWTGDLPGPMKGQDPGLRALFNRVESTCLEYIGADMPCLTSEEEVWLYALDRIELWLWAQDQAAMGNRNTVQVHEILFSEMTSGKIPLPEECLSFVTEYQWTRLSDFPPTVKA